MPITVEARALARRHPVLTYVVLAYALGWSWCVPLAVHGDVVRTGVGWPTHLPGLAGPALAAVGVTGDGRRFRGMGPLAVGWAVGLAAGSVVLTWLYREGGRSVLLVAA